MHIDQEPVVGTDTIEDPDPASGPVDTLREPGAAVVSRPLPDQTPETESAADGSTTSKWRETFSSLGNRDFRFLWFGTLFMMAASRWG